MSGVPDKDELAWRAQDRRKAFEGMVTEFSHSAEIDAIAQALHDGTDHQGVEPVEEE